MRILTERQQNDLAILILDLISILHAASLDDNDNNAALGLYKKWMSQIPRKTLLSLIYNINNVNTDIDKVFDNPSRLDRALNTATIIIKELDQ